MAPDGTKEQQDQVAPMKTLNAASNVYKEVGRQQVYLTREQEIELVNRYKVVREKLHRYILVRSTAGKVFVERLG